jgi:hypothetical protein
MVRFVSSPLGHDRCLSNSLPITRPTAPQNKPQKHRYQEEEENGQSTYKVTCLLYYFNQSSVTDAGPKERKVTL